MVLCAGICAFAFDPNVSAKSCDDDTMRGAKNLQWQYVCLGVLFSGSAVCADAQWRYVCLECCFIPALSQCRMLRRVFALVGAESARVLSLIQNTMKRREGLISRLFCCSQKIFSPIPADSLYFSARACYNSYTISHPVGKIAQV